MIKKCFGWFDIYYAGMLLGVTFAISNALYWQLEYCISLDCIRIQLVNIQTDNKRGEQKIQSSC